MPADFMCLFEDVFITHCGEEGKHMDTNVSWPFVWAVWPATDTQLEAEARVRKLEGELKLGKDVGMSTTQHQDWLIQVQARGEWGVVRKVL